MHRPLRLATLAVLGATALVGCATGEVDPPTATPTTSDTASPTPTSSPGTTAPTAPPSPTATTTEPATTPTPTGDGAGVPTLSTRCQLSAEGAGASRVEFAVPDGWQVQDGNCQFLDPSLEQLPEDSEPDTALSVTVSDQDFSTVSRTEEIDGEVRWVGARSGYQAVRIRGESAGQALRPAGEGVQLWLVDLDAGADASGGTLVLRAGPSAGASFQLAAEAADRIADTLRVVPVAAPDAPVVVTRAEGGGAPWTVTLDQDAGCLQLRAGGPADDPVDEACDIAAPDGAVTGAILGDDDLRVVAGLAPARASVVQSDAAPAPHGGVTVGLEGASAFAYRAGAAPIEVQAIDAAGQPLASGTIG